MEREIEKKLLEKEKCLNGWSHRGNGEDLKFWTQNSQYQEDKSRNRLVYFVLSSILIHNVFVTDLFFVFHVYMYTV